MIGKTIEIKKINDRNHLEIFDYLHQYGLIVGEKDIQHRKKLHGFIIEFADYSRTWMLTEEIEQKTIQHSFIY